MVASRIEQRHRALLIIPSVVTLLVALFLFVISSTQPPTAGENAPNIAHGSSSASAESTTIQPAPDVLQRIDEQAEPPVKQAAAAPDEPLAIVDGIPIFPRELQDAIAIDAVMADLTGQPPTHPSLLLEQLVNTQLVLRGAGDNIPAIDTAARLASLLDASDRNPAALDQALAASSIDRERFELYFTRLVAADVLARANQADSGQKPADYIRQLQRQARISFGGDASALLAGNTAGPASQPNAARPEPDIVAIDGAAIDAEEVVGDSPVVSEARGTNVGQIAPQFSLPALDGEQGDYALERLRGQPLVLSFWTTWCPYCLRQTPVLVDANREWSERGIQFVGINVQEERSAVEPYVAEHGIAYPILLDIAGDTARAFAIQGYPTTYFLDADNRIVARHVGALTEQQLTEYLQNLLPPTGGS